MHIQKNFDLTDYNSYKVKAICRRALFPNTEQELFEILTNDMNKIVIGNGNNIILSKEYYPEDFVILNGCLEKVKVENDVIVAEAGATLKKVSEIALNNSLSGLEVFYDIPSSVGGAVVMNAGTKEGEIKDIITKVRYIDLEEFNLSEVQKDDLKFEYRNSLFQEDSNKIVTKVWFKLWKHDYKKISMRMNEIKVRRWLKQPRNLPNSGSVFKRPRGKFVGPMIEELGMKGLSIGGAQISEKHAGFIVNLGKATGQDILELIYLIRERVKEKYKVLLEVEQRVI